MENLFLVTVPNQDGQESDLTFGSVRKGIHQTDKSLFNFVEIAEVPTLNHGTLDSLVSLSDDLLKTNIQVEVSILCPRQLFVLPFLFGYRLCTHDSFFNLFSANFTYYTHIRRW